MRSNDLQSLGCSSTKLDPVGPGNHSHFSLSTPSIIAHVDSTSLTIKCLAAKCTVQGAPSVQAPHLMRHVSRDTLGRSAIKAARHQPQLMLSNDIPGCCAAIVGHHMQALLPPELPLPLPHPQLTALHGQQHWPRAVELVPAAQPCWWDPQGFIYIGVCAS